MPKPPAPRLARGLNALIAPREKRSATVPAKTDSPSGDITHLPADAIQPNPHQPRNSFDEASIRELSDSIRAHGILQPIIVRPIGDGLYELVAGERRWRAAQVAGLKLLPAIIREVSDSEALELALIENLQREDLNAIERATAYNEYVETMGVSIEKLSRRIGESRANIVNYLRLLKLQSEIREMIISDQLGMGQARAIAGIEDQQRQLAVARLAVRRNLAVRQVEELAKNATSVASTPTETPEKTPSGLPRHLAEVEQNLSRAVGLSVKLQPGRRKNAGRVVIAYRNLEEFDHLSELLGSSKAVE
ncbi:MAG: ParB/RepB/Spo0J family partition protein [Planctomycetota bacterium]